MNAFLELFSDEAATPRPEFLNNLQANYLRVAGGGKLPRLSAKRKIILGVSILALIAALLALVFLPRRDMSNPSTNSLIETVVEQSQENVENFTENAATETTQNNNQNSGDPTSQQTGQPTQATNTSLTTPNSNAPTNSPVPLNITDFNVAYWNLDIAELAGPPTLPAGPANVTQSISTIDFSWGLSSPNPAIQTDGFVAQFSKSAAIPAGQYKVEFASDNGLRMHVNESVVFDRWLEAAPSGVGYFTTDPAVPITSITIDYYEHDGPANISIMIEKL